MTITERITAAAFAVAYSQHWHPDMEAVVGKAMKDDARLQGHRRGMPPAQASKAGLGMTITDAGKRALEMIAAGVSTREVAAATGLHPSHVSRMRTDMRRRAA